MKLERERVEREEFADAQPTVFKRRINSGASKSMSRKNAARSSGPWHWPVVPPSSLPVTNTGQCTTGSGPSLSPHKLCTMEHWPRLRSVHQWLHAEPATRCFSPGRPLQRWTTPSGRTTSSTKRSGPWSSQRGASRRNTMTRQAATQRRVSVRGWNNNSTMFCKKCNYDTCSDPCSSGFSRPCQFCGQQQKTVEPEQTGRLDQGQRQRWKR